MYEIEFNQFTILQWWNPKRGDFPLFTVSTSHHKGSRLNVKFEKSEEAVCLLYAGNISQAVATGHEKPEEAMFKIISQPTEESCNV